MNLYAILARDAPRAVIFARGPSKRVLLIAWNTADDTFEDGQWFKGRIYERRCDLSPDGKYLLYFAANHKKPFGSWTAISRPPYLTALALWPKGDAWGGGGHFESRKRVLLNHRPGSEMELGPDFHVPKWLEVSPFGRHSGWGEDDPVWAERLTRDGWTMASAGKQSEREDLKVWIRYDPPIIWEKRHGSRTLRMMIRGIKQLDGPWYVVDHEVVDGNGRTLALPRTAWADWSQSGDLLHAHAGKLFRNGEMIADFTDRKFEARAAPQAATRWL